MISLHAGRLLLVCGRSSRTWHVRVVLGPKAEHRVEVDTGLVQLREAVAKAQVIYAEAVAEIRPASERRMCWDCLQWDTQRNRCELGLPEAKRSGGRCAPLCEMFEQAN